MEWGIAPPAGSLPARRRRGWRAWARPPWGRACPPPPSWPPGPGWQGPPRTAGAPENENNDSFLVPKLKIFLYQTQLVFRVTCFSRFWQCYMIRDPECFNLRYILNGSTVLILKFVYYKILSGYSRSTKCKCQGYYLTPFLEFFMTYATTFMTWMCLFVLKKLRRRCIFCCAWQNEENGHIEVSYDKNNIIP